MYSLKVLGSLKHSGTTINHDSAKSFGPQFTKSQPAISLISYYSFFVLKIISSGQGDLFIESDLESF